MKDIIYYFLQTHFTLTSHLGYILISLLINTLACWGIVHYLYYPKSRNRDYYFTFLLLSTSVFLLIAILLRGNADMGIGAALGLFAIFGIMRYRTESVPIREMTYLFFLVALSVTNGKCEDFSLLEQLIINGIFIGCAWVCEHLFGSDHIGCKLVKYDNINLIQPEHREELIADLEKRLGVKVCHVEVGAIDFLTDMTMLRVFYENPYHVSKTIDSMLKFPR